MIRVAEKSDVGAKQSKAKRYEISLEKSFEDVR